MILITCTSALHLQIRLVSKVTLKGDSNTLFQIAGSFCQFNNKIFISGNEAEVEEKPEVMFDELF